MFITYQVKEVFKNLNKGSIFQLNNLLRVQKIAIILIAYTIGNFLYSYIINEFLYSHYHIRSLELKYQLNMVTFTCGIVLLLTAQTFKVGILLEEENKLTI
ncbi:DUF2975 domain-containing protein [Pedobacter westerhofensis]|uniref:DUF2975 domain-containing protein n=1 Tax=Pedobacter westerhofensis TaxID=425512 RepID=UPI00115BACE4